jgi:spermidine synthase
MRAPPFPSTASPRHAVLMFLTSASVLAYEILLMRLLSIGQWHHFAYMVISIALLGFGAAGAFLFLTFDRIKANPDAWLLALAAATAISFSFAAGLTRKVGLDPLNLVWQKIEWFKMWVTYLLMALPFLLAGGILGIILTGAGEEAHRMYGVDLLGAGCGALAVVPALYLGPPWHLLPLLGGLVLFGAAWCRPAGKRPFRKVPTILGAAFLMIILHVGLPPEPGIHETKALPMTLSFPDARIEAERTGPLGMIHVVGSALIRHVPGLSLTFGLSTEGGEVRLPEQKGIFLDGDGLSPITRFAGDPEELAHLDFTTMALPYHLRRPGKVLVLGAGGGSDVLLALRHRCPQIVALEANRQIAELVSGSFGEFSGHLYSRPGVRLEVGEARQYLQAAGGGFDLIQLSLVDSFGASAGGLHSAAESYLYTTEALHLYLSRLSDAGMLVITRWLKVPPRDSLRLTATALAALRGGHPSEHPERHLLLIRSWKTFTLVVSRSPLGPEEIERARKFCGARCFDLAYYAGMRAGEANRYDVLQSPDYFLGARAISGPGAKSFLDGYIFDVSPTTDDRPYFSHFFRWDRAAELFRHLRREWLPMVELGYLFILATLVQSVFAGGVLILLPLAFLPWVHRRSGGAGPRPPRSLVLGVLVYFGCIGGAFMFMEMALLPKYTLLLSHPVYAAAVVLGSLLVFAGCGSLSVRRFQAGGARVLWIPVACILVWVGFQALAGDRLVAPVMAWPFGGRLALAVCMISLLSFFLGWPFPAGLRVLAGSYPGLVPWAWGINGCASVIGAVLGKCLAVSIGFRLLMLLACGLYIAAAVVFHGFHGAGNMERSS